MKKQNVRDPKDSEILFNYPAIRKQYKGEPELFSNFLRVEKDKLAIRLFTETNKRRIAKLKFAKLMTQSGIIRSHVRSVDDVHSLINDAIATTVHRFEKNVTSFVQTSKLLSSNGAKLRFNDFNDLYGYFMNSLNNSIIDMITAAEAQKRAGLELPCSVQEKNGIAVNLENRTFGDCAINTGNENRTEIIWIIKELKKESVLHARMFAFLMNPRRSSKSIAALMKHLKLSNSRCQLEHNSLFMTLRTKYAESIQSIISMLDKRITPMEDLKSGWDDRKVKTLDRMVKRQKPGPVLPKQTIYSVQKDKEEGFYWAMVQLAHTKEVLHHVRLEAVHLQEAMEIARLSHLRWEMRLRHRKSNALQAA